MSSINQDEQKKLWDNLSDIENREAMSSDISTTLAFQIKALREKVGLTQEELAESVGVKESTIIQLENPNYKCHSLETLKALAAVFDVALVVRFVSFGGLVNWHTNLTPEKIAPPNHSEEVRKQTNTNVQEEPSSGSTIVGGYYFITVSI